MVQTFCCSCSNAAGTTASFSSILEDGPVARNSRHLETFLVLFTRVLSTTCAQYGPPRRKQAAAGIPVDVGSLLYVLRGAPSRRRPWIKRVVHLIGGKEPPPQCGWQLERMVRSAFPYPLWPGVFMWMCHIRFE